MNQGTAPGDVIERLGFTDEIGRLEDELAEWASKADPEMRKALAWQFRAGSKYFRPLTIFACFRSIYEGPTPGGLIRSAAALEMMHNMSLIIDDIVDRSPERRGVKTLHHEFGELHALMVAGYIVAEAYRLVEQDSHDIALLSELLRRLGVAEVYQWRVRRQPRGVMYWLAIAREDTGSMFEVCAALGTRTKELRAFGQLVGILYHGCDDVGDVRGSDALGGGGAQDLQDGILTLPASLAIADERIAALFRRSTLSEGELAELGRAFRSRLPEAEAHLDAIQNQARQLAEKVAPHPEPLLALVTEVRALAGR